MFDWGLSLDSKLCCSSNFTSIILERGL